MRPFIWSLRHEFLNRTGELSQLESWWEGTSRQIINLYGRRRVGKSWLFRAFAHEKPALILVSERIAEGSQLDRFGDQIEPHLGVRPALGDIPSLFRVAYRLGQDEKCLVVIDELPYLLPQRTTEQEQVLSAIQAVIEEESERSETKLMICGSHVAQMEHLMAERQPLRGRLQPLAVKPLGFTEGAPFLDGFSAEERIRRYAIAGGMPRYLVELSAREDLGNLICERILDPNGPLFNEPREILEQEFNQPNVYFSILEQLAAGAKPVDALSGALNEPTSTINRYLTTLRALRLVGARRPVGAPATARNTQYHLLDPFFRFWFRFVFPYQASFDDGLSPKDLYTSTVAPDLNDHIAPLCEELSRAWVLRNYGASIAQQVGPWWGRAFNKFRTEGIRDVEEIDVVGLRRNRITLVGECKWTEKQLGEKVLTDLETYKIPALRSNSGLKSAQELRIVLFSRAEFGSRVERAARDRDDLILVRAQDLTT